MGKNKTRTFSYTTPIMFQGTQYPSIEMDIEDSSGNVSNRKVFVDNKGQYYTLNNNGQAIPVSLLHQLDEVTVTPDKENLLSKQFNDYLTNSSDATQVQNVPHAEYNPNLTAETLHGAKVNSAWVKDHPNASAWGNFIGAVPFAVAAYPFAAAAGQGVMGTAIGQAARSGLTTFMANPIVNVANTALGYGFGIKGAYDVTHGEFTPETALELSGFVPMLRGFGFGKKANKLRNGRSSEAPFVREDYANADDYWNAVWDYGKANDIPLTTRQVGERPYTTAEIEDAVNSGRMIRFDKVNTSTHGEFFLPDLFEEHRDPTWILKQHILNEQKARAEMTAIMKDNPRGRSGIFLHTHDADTSIDSAPLAYKYATRLGKNFKEMPTEYPTVKLNNLGYNNVFKQGYGKELERAKALFNTNPDYKAALLRDRDGNITTFELTDDNGTFQIPLNSRQEVMDIINAQVDAFNKHFGTSYKGVSPYASRRTGEDWQGPRILYDDVKGTPDMYPWDFGEIFIGDNMNGYIYKQGGKLKRKLLTSLY